MTLFSPPPRRRTLETVDIGSVQMGLLGRVASPRGVQVMAVDGMLNRRAENQFTTTLRLLSYLLQIPPDGVMSVGSRPMHRSGPINFLSPGLAVKTRGGGPVTGAMCIFSREFFTSLAETEEGLHFDDVDYFTDMQSERMTHLGRAMFREAVAPGFAGSLFAESIGLAITVEIARYDGSARSSDGLHRGGLATWQMRRLEAYVVENLSADLTLDELARLIGISVRQLSRAVRQEKGVSVHRWVASRRLSEARRLLTETELPVQDVARMSAFHSASAFAAAFRAASGFSPGEFRRLSTE
jgi:AraC family transcriptional regulator